MSGELLLTNIGTVVSGDVQAGILCDVDTISVSDGRIERVGTAQEFRQNDYRFVIDVGGQTVIPGLIDAHVHNGAEDFSACLQMSGILEDALRNGTTTMISEGEQGPGYPRFYGDKAGVKAGAVFANRIYQHYHPGKGLKLHAGALVLTDDMQESDFAELRVLGINRVAEIGGGGCSDMERLRPMVSWARNNGFFISVHLAPPSIPGSAWLHAEDIIALQPDKVSHANGGTTGSSWSEIKQVIDHTRAKIELVPEGNYLNFNRILRYLKELGALDRVVLGSDAPTGACMLQGAINKAITRASCLNDIPAWQAISFATGNTADCYQLPVGRIAPGKQADLVVIDAPPGSVGEDALGAIEAGDLFGCSLVIADGTVVGLRGRDTRATGRSCSCNGRPLFQGGLHEFLYDPPHAELVGAQLGQGISGGYGRVSGQSE